jgi:adenylate cyclase
LLPALRAVSTQLSEERDLATLLESTLAALDSQFGITNAMVLLRDARADRLFTVASRGYERSGVGSEVALGQGIIGTAAQAGVPIRIGSMQAEALYSRAIREGLRAAGRLADLEAEIPLPGLAQPHSQMAVPIPIAGEVAGVLFVESTDAARFRYDDEDALVVLGRQLGLAIRLVTEQAETTDEATPAPAAPEKPQGSELKVRFFREQSTVFLDGEYLIKGVAGAIVWKLLREYAEHGRTSFTSRELRLDTSLGLPDLCDNLAARLILLERRLEERSAGISLSRTGRGRVELHVRRPLVLVEAQSP